MVDCCQLALYNSQLVFKVVIGAFAVISLLLAMFFGYNLRWRKQQIELSKRTNQLEKKNGKEEALILTQQAQLDQLKAEIEKLKNPPNLSPFTILLTTNHERPHRPRTAKTIRPRKLETEPIKTL